MNLAIASPIRYAKLPSEVVSPRWSAWKRFRRGFMSAVYCFPDRGRFGLTPLQKHVLICGFPRSGTTMLQLMLENAMPRARRFGREVGGWRAATYSWRNHRVIISKVPHDIFRLQGLREFYASHPASLKVIVMVRDPRDVLTSQRETGGPPGYVVSPERWRSYNRAVQQEQSASDCMTVRYEDLIACPATEQARIGQFIDEPFEIPFDQFHKPSRPDFAVETLNGLRPIENSRVARWANPRHRDQLEICRSQLPELDQSLVTFGYEACDSNGGRAALEKASVA